MLIHSAAEIRMKKVLAIISLLFLVLNGNAQESLDTIKSFRLSEVVVKAERIIHKGDHDVLYLSNDNKKFGTNALDAVSSLELFQTAINETKLVSWDRQNVFILINGVPSTAYDLRGYKGEDIKNVEFYSIAPPQYMSLTAGPVVNIVVKKRHDRSYTGYFNTSNAVNTGFGTNQIDLTYADSLNQVKLGYLVDYRNIGNIDNLAEYTYSPQLHSQYRGTSRYKGQYHNISASYQRYQGNHLFNAKVYTIIEPLQDEEKRAGLISTDDTKYNGEGTSLLKSRSNTVAVDLYYRYLLKKGRLFAINVVNTFGNSYSDSKQSMLSENTGNNDYDYNLHSRVDNDSYSFITNAVYASPLWGGSLSVGSRYEYKQLNQTSFNNKYKPYSHYEFLNTGGSWTWNTISFVPAVGLNIFKQTSSGISQTSVLPYIRLYSDWWGKGKMKGTTVQLTLTMRNISPSLNEITESETYLDPWLISAGNPKLKDYWITSGKLSFAYFSPNNKNQIVFMVQPSYANNKIATTILKEGDNVYFRPQNIGGDFEWRFDLYGSWYPFKWLELSPYVEYYISRLETPSQNINFDYWRIGGNITASFENLSLIFSVNSPTKVYDGDLLSRGSLQYAGTIQYKIGNWSVGAKYNYSGHNNYTVSNLPILRYNENKDWKPLQHMVRLTATYTFSVGKSRRHDGKILTESSKDNTGLGKFNTPQISK